MSLETLRHQRDVISLEAVSGEAAQLSALSRLPAFLTSAKAVFQNQLEQTVKTVYQFAMDFNSVAAKLRRMDHATVRSVQVQVPQGLKVDMITYGHALTAASDELKSVDSDMIKPFLTWLNKNLSSPGQLKSLSGTLSISGYKPLPIGKLKSAIEACFHDAGRAEAIVPYGQAVRRSADWTDLEKSQLTLTRDLGAGLQKSVLDSMAELEISLETLLLRLTKESEKYAPSKVVVQELINTAFDVAEAIEFYGTVRYRAQEYDHSLQQITQKILPSA